ATATLLVYLFFALIPRHPPPTLFPYTTLFRSKAWLFTTGRADAAGEHGKGAHPAGKVAVQGFVQHQPLFGFAVAYQPQHLIAVRSEEHTSELQSRENLVCRLLLEKKKKNNN